MTRVSDAAKLKMAIGREKVRAAIEADGGTTVYAAHLLPHTSPWLPGVIASGVKMLEITHGSIYLAQNPPRRDEPRLPVGRAERFLPHASARARRVHEPAGADEDADVGDRAPVDGEEDHVAVAQVPSSDAIAGRRLLADAARQRDADLPEHVLDEAAAVEAGRVGAAVAVGRPDERPRDCRSRGAGCRRRRGRREVGPALLRATGQQEEGEEGNDEPAHTRGFGRTPRRQQRDEGKPLSGRGLPHPPWLTVAEALGQNTLRYAAHAAPQRVLRTAQGGALAKGRHLVVPGEG